MAVKTLRAMDLLSSVYHPSGLPKAKEDQLRMLFIFCHSIFLSDGRSDKKLGDKKWFMSMPLGETRRFVTNFVKLSSFVSRTTIGLCPFAPLAQYQFAMIRVVQADLNEPEHQAAILEMTRMYALDEMGNSGRTTRGGYGSVNCWSARDADGDCLPGL